MSKLKLGSETSNTSPAVQSFRLGTPESETSSSVVNHKALPWARALRVIVPSVGAEASASSIWVVMVTWSVVVWETGEKLTAASAAFTSLTEPETVHTPVLLL